jgi:hypothetical protein
MSFQQDLHGLPLSTTSAAAAEAFGRALLAYLRCRLDVAEWMHATLRADPGFALGHCLKGYLTLLAQRRSMLEAAADAHRAAVRLSALDTPRERAHVAALGAWVEGDVEGALAIWKQIVKEHPTDVLALRLALFNDFWLGRAPQMLATVAEARRHWHDGLQAAALVQSCHAFALHECGQHLDAEREARCAVERDRTDLWGVHAVAHALQTQGRSIDVVDWILSAEPFFDGANQIVHHLEWHRAMAHLERREFEAVLWIYDERVRNLGSPLVAAHRDFYLDIVNAASLLWYLRCVGIAVGDRWDELAERAEAKWDDELSAFVLPHWMMALGATGRRDTAERMLSALRAGQLDRATPQHLLRDVAAPVCEAIWLHASNKRSNADIVALPWDRLAELGGSLLQQDVFNTLQPRAEQ